MYSAMIIKKEKQLFLKFIGEGIPMHTKACLGPLSQPSTGEQIITEQHIKSGLLYIHRESEGRERGSE